MINSFSQDNKKEIIFPGIVLYKNFLSFNKTDINDIFLLNEHINKYKDSYEKSSIKNMFFHGLNKINRSDFADRIQKNILLCLADYCNTYEEAIHTIQWQEDISINVHYSGQKDFIYNPNKSFVGDNEIIKNTPFSRQIVVEILVDDNFSGGKSTWPYFSNLELKNYSSGDILLYPANYLFSKNQDAIISGRKISLITVFNGGKDFLAEEDDIEENAEIAFSYMR